MRIWVFSYLGSFSVVRDHTDNYFGEFVHRYPQIIHDIDYQKIAGDESVITGAI